MEAINGLGQDLCPVDVKQYTVRGEEDDIRRKRQQASIGMKCRRYRDDIFRFGRSSCLGQQYLTTWSDYEDTNFYMNVNENIPTCDESGSDLSVLGDVS